MPKLWTVCAMSFSLFACGSTATNPFDGGSTTPFDAGAGFDAGSGTTTGSGFDAGSVFDAGSGTTTGSGTGVGTNSCQQVYQCFSNCLNSPNCASNCIQGGTPAAAQLMQSLLSCLNVSACPSARGGICDRTSSAFSSSQCSACMSTATASGGLCYQQFQACNNNQ